MGPCGHAHCSWHSELVWVYVWVWVWVWVGLPLDVFFKYCFTPTETIRTVV